MAKKGFGSLEQWNRLELRVFLDEYPQFFATGKRTGRTKKNLRVGYFFVIIIKKYRFRIERFGAIREEDGL